VRDGISVFAKLPEAEVNDAIERLRRDLADGIWQQRHHDLLERDSLHLGYYVIVVTVD